MPLEGPETLGTETDGRPSEEYCRYCYQKGAFLQACTMEQMIAFCLQCEGVIRHYGSPEQARRQMEEWFPTLRRWRQP